MYIFRRTAEAAAAVAATTTAFGRRKRPFICPLCKVIFINGYKLPYVQSHTHTHTHSHLSKYDL